jgi:hypothetical protein
MTPCPPFHRGPFGRLRCPIARTATATALLVIVAFAVPSSTRGPVAPPSPAEATSSAVISGTPRCTGSNGQGTPNACPGPIAPVSGTGTFAPSSFPTPIQHVVVVLMENQNYDSVLAQGPFEAYLAQNFAAANNDYSVHHYSVPGYLAATSGLDSAGTVVHNVSNLGDLSDRANRSWAAFEQGMPKPCDRTSDWPSGYDAAHNPFILYQDIVGNSTRCGAHDLPWSALTNDSTAGGLPNYSFVAPNTTDDDHNSSIATGDAWLKSWLGPLINDSAIFANTAFLVSYDESANDSSTTVNGSSGGHVYTVAVSPYSRGLSSDAFFNTYSLLTTTEWLLGLPGGTLGADSWVLAPPMTSLFAFPTPSFPLTFSGNGIRSGMSWSVELGGGEQVSPTKSIDFFEPNGTYSYSVTPPTGYITTAATGSLSVNGTAVAVPVSFVRAYALTFKESGLPSGTFWSVTVGTMTPSSSTASLAFQLPNGTYTYRVGLVPGWRTAGTGTVTLAGAAATLCKEFSLVKYIATFREVGLPSGTNWSVTVPPTTVWSTMAYINFHLPNGSYSYTVGSVANYSRVGVGSFFLNGTGTILTTHFTLVKYKVTFLVAGLPAHATWTIVVAGLKASTNSDSLSVHLANGTWSYNATSTATGFSARLGNLTVAGTPSNVSVDFARGALPTPEAAGARTLPTMGPEPTGGASRWSPVYFWP